MALIRMRYDVAGAFCYCRVAMAATEAGKARCGLQCVGSLDPVLDQEVSGEVFTYHSSGAGQGFSY